MLIVYRYVINYNFVNVNFSEKGSGIIKYETRISLDDPKSDINQLAQEIAIARNHDSVTITHYRLLSAKQIND